MADVVTIPKGNRQAGTYTFTAPDPIPVGRIAMLTVTLDEADKLAVGKTLTWQFFVLADAGATPVFVNGSTWTSYGPGGLTVTDPDGTVRVNPDPRLTCPIANHTGKLLRGVFVLSAALRAGVVISVE
jgi:hypothetical protein